MNNPADQNNSTAITQKKRLIPKPENPITKAIIGIILILLAIVPIYSVFYAATGLVQSRSWGKVQASAIAQTGKTSLNPYIKTLFVEDSKSRGIYTGSDAYDAYWHSPELNIITASTLGVEPCVSKNWSYFNVSTIDKVNDFTKLRNTTIKISPDGTKCFSPSIALADNILVYLGMIVLMHLSVFGIYGWILKKPLSAIPEPDSFIFWCEVVGAIAIISIVVKLWNWL